MALLAAASFGDVGYERALLASLELAGRPRRSAHGLRFALSNQVGDAVILNALTRPAP